MALLPNGLFFSVNGIHKNTDCITNLMLQLWLTNKLNVSLDIDDEAKLVYFSQVSPI